MRGFEERPVISCTDSHPRLSLQTAGEDAEQSSLGGSYGHRAVEALVEHAWLDSAYRAQGSLAWAPESESCGGNPQQPWHGLRYERHDTRWSVNYEERDKNENWRVGPLWSPEPRG
jgi:hypothetical protein